MGSTSRAPQRPGAPEHVLPSPGRLGVGALVLFVAGCVTVGPPRRFDLEPPTLHARSAPLLLVHGTLMVGGRVRLGLTSFDRALVRALTADGFDVWLPALSAVAPSSTRVDDLRRAIDAVRARSGAARVSIIAHSQAGVDVRLLLDDPRDAAMIAGVITLSTPHHGTPLAEVALQLRGSLAESILDRIGRRVDESRAWPRKEGQLMELARELTPTAMAAFNAAHPAPSIPFFSLAASPEPVRDGACDGGAWPAPAAPGRRTLAMAVGKHLIDEATHAHPSNDGIVPTSSQRFAAFLGCAPLDHAGWLHPSPSGLDVSALLVELARALRDVERAGAGAMTGHTDRLGELIAGKR